MSDTEIAKQMPAEYYRRHAVRVQLLASEATTPAIKEHLQDVAKQYALLALRTEISAQNAEQSPPANYFRRRGP